MLAGARLTVSTMGFAMGEGISRPIPMSRTVYGTATPFVGRTGEVERIYAFVRRAVLEKRLQHVAITGPSGIGKSRLVEEFLMLVSAGTRRIRTYRCSLPSSPHAPPFAVLTQIVRQKFEVQPQDPDEVVRDKMLTALGSAVDVKRLHDAAHLLGYLLQLPYALEVGDPEGAADISSRAARTCFELLQAEAASRPMAIVLDRWDQGTAEAHALVRELTEALAALPVLLLTLSREPVVWPDGHPQRPFAVPLPPITRHNIEQLMGAFVRAPDVVPKPLVNLLAERTAGNPRLLENQIRLLVHRQVLAYDGERWRVAVRQLDPRTLPVSPEVLARERVTSLTGLEREALMAAAVVGPTFWLGAVRSVLRASPSAIEAHNLLGDALDDDLQRAMAALVESDFVRGEATSSVHAEQELAFVNPDERAALLSSLEARPLRRMHRLLAQWMAAVQPYDPVHFAFARAEHLEAGGRPAAAAEALREAAASARDSFDNPTAKALLARALDLLDADSAGLQARVAFDLAWVTLISGDYERAERLYRLAAAVAEVVRDKALIGRVANHVGKIHLARGCYDAAQTALERAFELFEETEDLEGIANVREDIGKLIWHRGARGAYKQALSYFQKSLSLRRTLGDPGNIARSLSHIANIHGLTGRIDDAERCHREALELRHAAGDRRGEATTLNGLAATIYERGDIEGALALWDKALAIAVDIGERTQYTLLLCNIAEARMGLGQLDDAERGFQEAEETAQELGAARILGYALQLHATLLAQRSDIDGSNDKLTEAMRVAEETGNQHLLASCLRTRAQIAASKLNPTGDMTLPTGTPPYALAALEDLERALRILDELGDLPSLHRTLDVNASLLEGLGWFEESIPLRKRAKEIRKQIGCKA